MYQDWTNMRVYCKRAITLRSKDVRDNVVYATLHMMAKKLKI